MIARLICWLYGHKRGRHVTATVGPINHEGIRLYECPRCKATWTRRVKA